MSHIVIHDDSDGITQYRQFDDVGDAARYLERLHNVEGIHEARLYALHEVEFSIRAYVKVEIDSTPAPEPEVATFSEPAPVAHEPEPIDDGVEYVDASAVELYEDPPELGPEPADAPMPTGEPRRGLFGR